MVGRVVAGASAGLLLVAACKTSSGPGPNAPSLAEPYAGANCAAVQAPREPELMAWDARSRAALDRIRRQSVVAVRYEAKGCEVVLEVLPGCIGPKNKYVYSPMSSAATRAARNVDELLATLPVGADNVSMSLGNGRVLRADFKLVGAAALPVGTTISEYDLVGPECKRATHVVSAVYVGGFALAQTAASATVNVFSGGGDALVREGFAPVCDRAAIDGVETQGCSTPLRVALVPLNGAAPPPTCPEGWTFDGKRCTNGAAARLAGGGSGGAEPRIFDASSVERVVREKSPSTKRTCWEAAPGSIHKMSVTIATTINTDGKVVSADPQGVTAEGNADAAAIVARCIANDVLGWEFPPPDRPQSFALPFHLLRQ